MPDITFDPFNADVLADPYPHYRQLRDESPVHYLEEHDLYLVSRYDDAVSVLGNAQLFSNDGGYGPLFDLTYGDPEVTLSGPGRMLFRPDARGRLLLLTDPPVHHGIRKLALGGFSPRRMAVFESQLRDLASRQIDEMVERSGGSDPIDLASDFGLRFPFAVICEILGIPEADTPEFRYQVDTCVFRIGQPRDAEIAACSSALCDFFDVVVEERKRSPRDDVISRLVTAAEASGEALTTPEVVAFALFLFLAGGDTSAGLLTHWFLLVLLQRPDLMASFREDRSLIGPAMDELLRYDNSNQGVNRLATATVTIGDTTVPENAMVIVLTASGNRDERRWGPDAGNFKIGRDTRGSLALGRGIHLCLGSHLVRLETRVAIETFLDKVDRVDVSGPIERKDSFFVRQCSSIPAYVTATGS